MNEKELIIEFSDQKNEIICTESNRSDEFESVLNRIEKNMKENELLAQNNELHYIESNISNDYDNGLMHKENINSNSQDEPPINKFKRLTITIPTEENKVSPKTESNRSPQRNADTSAMLIGRGILLSNLEFRSSPKNLKKKNEKSNFNKMKVSMNKSMTKSITQPPLKIFQFMVIEEEDNWYKVKIILYNLFLPHICAISLTFIFINIHIKINNICWMEPYCNCDNLIYIKIYSLTRSIFSYWNLIYLIGYYSCFNLNEMRDSRILKIIFNIVYFGPLTLLYLFSDGSTDTSISLYFYGVCFFMVFFFFSFVLYRTKFNLKIFFRKTSYQLLLFIILFSHLIIKRYAVSGVKNFLVENFKDLGRNFSQVVISIYAFIYKIFFKFLILKFGVFVLSETENYNAIIFFMRIVLTFILCINTSNIFEMDITDWGGWILITTYIASIFELYTRVNPFIKSFKYIKSKIIKKTKIQIQSAKNEKILELKMVLSGYLLDFQFILIPRLLIMYFYNHLIDYHSGDFSKNCMLELDSNFPKKPETLCLVLGLNIIFPIFFFFWMVKKKQLLFEYRFENYNIFQRTYLIFLIHNYFEWIFQDFLTTKK